MRTRTEIHLRINAHGAIEKCDDDGFQATLRRDGPDYYFLQFSWGLGWEHASLSRWKAGPRNLRLPLVPTWEDMCWLKEILWEDEELVVQYHPRKSEYVNHMDNVLHLWRPTDQEMPSPPPIFVGPK